MHRFDPTRPLCARCRAVIGCHPNRAQGLDLPRQRIRGILVLRRKAAVTVVQDQAQDRILRDVLIGLAKAQEPVDLDGAIGDDVIAAELPGSSQSIAIVHVVAILDLLVHLETRMLINRVNPRHKARYENVLAPIFIPPRLY